MKINIKFLVLALLLLFFYFWVNRATEEENILRRLESLRELVEYEKPEPPLVLLGRAKEISRYFKAPLLFDLRSLDFDTITIEKSRELIQKISQARSRLVSLEVVFKNIRVEINNYSAKVKLETNILGSIKGGEGQFLDIHSAELSLENIDSDWFIVGGKHLENLRN